MLPARKRRGRRPRTTQVVNFGTPKNEVPSDNNVDLDKDAKDDDGATNSSLVQNSKGTRQDRKRKMAKISSNVGTSSRSRAESEEDENGYSTATESELPSDNVELGLDKDSQKDVANGRRFLLRKHPQETPKFIRRGPKFFEEESLMCHQCQRNDKGDVVRCKNCKRKRFCMPCLASWYPELKPEDAVLCPVCRGNCNCRACLRSTELSEAMRRRRVPRNEQERFEHSKYLLKRLLPYLRQLDKEQMIEKDIEAKRKGLSLPKLNIEKSEYCKHERVHCDNCKTSIFDYHRFCRKCSFRLCLICCYELRNGELLGGADPDELGFVNWGINYLHGCEYISGVKSNSAHEDAKPDSKKNLAHSDAKPDVRGWSRSGWHAKSDGSIPCPKNKCRNRFLELRSVLGPNFISELVHKAEEAEAHKLHNAVENPVSWCSCLRLSRNTDCRSNNNTLKAASRENSIDNFLYHPQAISQKPEELKHFQCHWSRGEPVIVSNVLERTSGLSWEPLVMWRAFRLTNMGKGNQHLDMKALDCLNWAQQGDINIHQFFTGYTTGRWDWCGWPQMLRLNDWPPDFFKERAPRHYAEFMSLLPFGEYTHPFGGVLNLASKVPRTGSTPNMEPKAYIAYGFPQELGRGDSVVKLHYDISDTVNILTHTAEKVRLTSDQLRTIEHLKRKHHDQDKRELLVTYQEESNILAGGDASDGVLWDVFRRQDIPVLKEYLKKHFKEFRHNYCCPLNKVIHPIHDQTIYLTVGHKRKLKEEYGIEPWTFIQKLGDAVFIPAGCPYQVRNLKSCINVALSFVSPESVGECFRLAEEIRTLPINHRSSEDKLEVKKMTIFAINDVLENLSRASLNENLKPERNIQEKQPTGEKDKWDEYTTGVFLDVCVEEIASGNRADADFNEEGWINVIAKFNGKTGRNYDCRQLKDKWDILKGDFNLWEKLLEIGVGWDPVKKTIKASQEFWVARRKENPEFLKFRFQCPSHLDKLEACFKDTKATGDVALKTHADPSSAEVRVCGKENEDNHELGAFGEGVRDSDSVAYEEPHTSYSGGHTTSNDNPNKRQIQLNDKKQFGKVNKLQHSVSVSLEEEEHSIPLEVTHRRAPQENQPIPDNDKWDDFTIGVFLEVCIQEIAAGNRPHDDFNKEGWNNVVAKFNGKTGQNYDHRQLKKELDNLKNDFTLWAKLVENQTGLGWDPIKKTVKAPPRFWESRKKENPAFLKFEHQGPPHLDKLEACFEDAKGTSYVAIYADPSSNGVGFYGEENEDNLELRASNEDDGDSGDVAIEETHHTQNVQHREYNENNPELRASEEGFSDDDVAIEETHHMHNVEPRKENENNPELRASDEGVSSADVTIREENENNPESRAFDEGVSGSDVAIDKTHDTHNVVLSEENEDNPELRASHEGDGDVVGIANLEPLGENEDNLELRASDEGVGDGDGVANKETYHSHNAEPGPSNSVPKKRKRLRKRLRKAKKHSGKAVKAKANNTATGFECNLDLDSCLTLLDSVPGLEKGSTLYFIACRVLTKIVNRQTFVHLMRDDPKLAFGWLNTFTLEDLKNLTG
ncbi:uncharacterized protein LOC107605295 isoform X3 [Arachis ipaensis]|uniref:uncharacterized protein LOC107605295 isoform X3 n=1 Tax=Arachis ipaensis TaxID=130454 RepID=UPI000A2B7E85|nr:uncharacterized protein LOC107605295 isoform X3 [Arachis ipaensis]